MAKILLQGSGKKMAGKEKERAHAKSLPQWNRCDPIHESTFPGGLKGTNGPLDWHPGLVTWSSTAGFICNIFRRDIAPLSVGVHCGSCGCHPGTR